MDGWPNVTRAQWQWGTEDTVFGCSSEAKRTNNFPVEEQGNESVTLTLQLTPEAGKTGPWRSSADRGRPVSEEERGAGENPRLSEVLLHFPFIRDETPSPLSD
ncbi:unnamed protein product [Boreogadus saida]